ncbi:MAG TPA: molybdopterin cofactor-binding domain-containing protein, partial [Burkholderiales bacterium]|nr:molybdopterin cofactor-binding domain-containing protein [Burkholderiales bacterium]
MADANARRKLPGSLDTNRNLSQWLDINRDGTVTMRPGKIEIGQGILTALRQIVAEELDVNLERVNLVTAVTALSPNEGITSGSQSIEQSGVAFRYAAAEARELLLARAGVKLGVSIEQLSVSDGVISARNGGSVTYWEITDDALLKREASGEATPKPHTQHKIVGTASPRVDIPRKVAGVPTYVQDLEPPGMLHGRVSRPPSYGAELISVDLDDVRTMPGVVAVVRDGRFLGVVAEREEQAIRAQRRLTRDAQWREGATLPEFNPRYLLKGQPKSDVISEKADATVAVGGRMLEGEYTRQFLAHASANGYRGIGFFA